MYGRYPGLGQTASTKTSAPVTFPLMIPSGASLITPATLSAASDVAQAAVPRAMRSSSSRGSGNPFRIIPEECERMARPLQTPAEPVAAGGTIVVAWPYVLLSDEEAASTLDAILGTGTAGGGPAMIAGLTDIASAAALSTSTSQATPLTIEQIQERARSYAPSWATGGFIRDADADQNVTRGYLWLAFKWPTAINAMNLARRIMSAVLLRTRTGLAEAVAKLNIRRIGVQMLAENDTDVALEDAALKSVVGFVQGITGIGAAFGFLSNLSPNATAVTRNFRSQGDVVLAGAQAVAAADGKVQEAEALALAALSVPVESAVTAQAQLIAIKMQLLDLKAKIAAGIQAAPEIVAWVERESDPASGSIARSVRDTLYLDIRGRVENNSVPTAAREWSKCVYWKSGQSQLDHDLRVVGETMAQAGAAAVALKTNTDAAILLMASIDAAIGRVDYALSQLPLNFFERDFAGAPMYMWLGGGVVALLGGALVVRQLKKKKAQPALVSKNARRRRKRR